MAETAMTYEAALQALADDAASAHTRWQEGVARARDRGEKAPNHSANHYYAFAAKRALIVALSGVHEEGVDPGPEVTARAEEMIKASRHYQPERWAA